MTLLSLLWMLLWNLLEGFLWALSTLTLRCFFFFKRTLNHFIRLTHVLLKDLSANSPFLPQRSWFCRLYSQQGQPTSKLSCVPLARPTKCSQKVLYHLAMSMFSILSYIIDPDLILVILNLLRLIMNAWNYQ